MIAPTHPRTGGQAESTWVAWSHSKTIHLQTITLLKQVY